MPGGERTGVDELLLGNFPALLRVDLCFEFANLEAVSQVRSECV
jgi:hypothetical protein